MAVAEGREAVEFPQTKYSYTSLVSHLLDRYFGKKRVSIKGGPFFGTQRNLSDLNKCGNILGRQPHVNCWKVRVLRLNLIKVTVFRFSPVGFYIHLRYNHCIVQPPVTEWLSAQPLAGGYGFKPPCWCFVRCALLMIPNKNETAVDCFLAVRYCQEVSCENQIDLQMSVFVEISLILVQVEHKFDGNSGTESI
ncbi:hypothetical protein CSKR_105221 [Clonorchis sinensis]|uniref:Uncharacterized protein n=1 Tax=Clonorchis sinensis TaxID=79923 RepID=A0A419PD01_CLOSI|nr:hypothetical protein CSKR_105221 [Clonorchis sinensis]